VLFEERGKREIQKATDAAPATVWADACAISARFFGRATGAILRWEGFCAWRMKPSQETCL